MTSHLLDTNVIIDALNDKRGRVALLKSLLQDGHLLGCCAINVAEVYAGMKPKEKASTDRLLQNLEYFDITRVIAEKAGSLKNFYTRQGISLSLADVTIAAVALSNNLTLITDNQKHYPMPDLRIYQAPAQ